MSENFMENTGTPVVESADEKEKAHIEEGDVGDGFGAAINNGTFLVRGNAGHGLGNKMLGGEIIVQGDAGNYLGDKMMGGSITVEGDVGHMTCNKMLGGTVHILSEHIRSFSRSAFMYENQGVIEIDVDGKTVTIWENGAWTKEGKQMQTDGRLQIE